MSNPTIIPAIVEVIAAVVMIYIFNRDSCGWR